MSIECVKAFLRCRAGLKEESAPAENQRGGAANGVAQFGSFTASSFPGMPAAGGAPIFGSGSRDFESATLARMRQRAERDRLIAEMAAKDADD